MNKKLKVLLLTLVLFGGAASTSASAASVVPQTNGIFSPVGNFFSDLFGGNENKLENLTPSADAYKGERSKISGVADYASNTAYGSDGTNEDSGTGTIDISEDVTGLTMVKSVMGTGTNPYYIEGGVEQAGGTGHNVPIPFNGSSTPLPWVTAGVPDDGYPATAGDVVDFSLHVKNTGRTTDDFIVQDTISDIPGVVSPASASRVSPTFTISTTDGTTSTDSGTPISPTSGNITDLEAGVKFTGVDSGDEFTVDFQMEIDPYYADIHPSEPDFWLTNVSNVCTPFDKNDPNYIHIDESAPANVDYTNPSDSIYFDGTIMSDGAATPSYYLCSTGADKIAVDGDRDGKFELPDLPVIVTKKVKDVGGSGTTANDDVAEPGEKLTYDIKVTSINTAVDTYTVQDSLDGSDHPSLTNVNFDPLTNTLKMPNGTTDLTTDDVDADPTTVGGGTPLTLQDLQTGFNISLRPFQTIEFKFDGIVKDPINPYILEGLGGTRILNTANVCTTVATPECTDSTVSIKTPYSRDLDYIVIDKVLDTDSSGLRPDPDGSGAYEVDPTDFGSGAIPTSGKPTFDYTITVKNVADDSIEFVSLNDILPEDYYFGNVSDPTDPTLVANLAMPVTGTKGGNAVNGISASPTVGDLVDAGTTGDAITIDSFIPHSGLEANFSISFFDDFYTDAYYDNSGAGFDTSLIFPENLTFTNTAETCISSSNSYADEDGGCKNAAASASFDGEKIDPLNPDGVVKTTKEGELNLDTAYDKDSSGDITEGDLVTYTLNLFNLSGTEQILSVYDPLKDAEFRDSTGALLASASTNELTLSSTALAEFVDETGAVLSANPKVVDLTTVDAVNVHMSPYSTARITFDIEISGETPAASATNDTVEALENLVVVCPQDTTTATDTTLSLSCDDSGNTLNLAQKAGLIITKDAKAYELDGTTPSTLAVEGGTIKYTITVTNLSTTNDTVNYKIHDNLTDSNISGTGDLIVTHYDAGGTAASAVTYPVGSTEYNNFFDSSVGLDDALDRTEHATYEYTANVADPFAHEGLVVNQACANSFTTTSVFSSKSMDTGYICGYSLTPTDTSDPSNSSSWSITKRFIDTNDGPSDDTTVAEMEDNFEVNYTIVHEDDGDAGTEVGTMQLFELPAFDTNIDYAAHADPAGTNDPIVVKSTTDPRYDASGTPDPTEIISSTKPTGTGPGTQPKESDLFNISTDPVSAGGGIYVTLTEDESAVLSFPVTTVSAADWTPATEIFNNVAVCDGDALTAYDSAKCDETGTIYPTAGYDNLSIKKEVTDSVTNDAPPVTNKADIDGDGDTDDYYVTDGGKVSYKITIQNTGSLDISAGTAGAHGLTISDVVDTTYFATTGSEVVTIKQYKPTGINPITSEVIWTAVPGATDSITLANISNTPYAYTHDLPAGYKIEVEFTATLKDELGLDTDESVTNIGQACYESEGYNVYGAAGTHCYQSGVDTPYLGDDGDITDLHPDDEGFTVDKQINDSATSGVEHQLEPGETGINMVITVINNNDGFAEDGTPLNAADTTQTITLTDELADQNFNYEAVIAAGGTPVEVSNTSAFGTGVTLPVDAEFDGTSGEDFPLINLLPKNAATTWHDTDAQTRYADQTSFPDASRGGIALTIPANQEYQLTFKVDAQGNLRTISKVRNFFDFTRFFS